MHSKWDRRVIPKWRASAVAANLPESKPLREQTNRPSLLTFNPTSITDLVKEWNTQPSIGVAADILSFSNSPDAIPFITDIAKKISEEGASFSAPTPLLNLAKRIANIQEVPQEEGVEDLPVGLKIYHQSAARLKQKLRLDPRNAVALVDLARLYAALGQDMKARDAILMAAALRPNHRFILRSACRLLVHTGETERALNILKNTEGVLDDPWLLAPLISITEILNKPQKYLRKARSLFSSGVLHPMHLSELGGAIATIQIIDGDIKSAKKTFNAALTAPNDNTVAQAMWASENFSIPIKAREEWFNKFSCEARYYQRYADGDFEGATKAAIYWFKDEPFSTRPMKAASFSAGIFGDNKLSEKFALQGLRLDKDDIELRNNLIFALGSQNKIDEAVLHLQHVVQTERRDKGGISGHSMANIGMLLYRLGEYNEAEKSYRRAISHFKKNGDNFAYVLASTFMAREASLSRSPNAQELITEALDINKKADCSASKKILSLLTTSNSSETQGVSKTQDQEVVYDRSKNTLIIKKLDPF